MTAIPKAADLISPDEYLEGERLAEVRHEYVDGRVYAMAGTSDDHNRIAVPGIGVEIPLERIFERTAVAVARAPVG